MSYRTVGQQIAPLIIRTRGIDWKVFGTQVLQWEAMIHLLRGMHILVPRNMTQAAGFYNTLLQIEQPAVVVESLNGYRLKEKRPSNLGEFTFHWVKLKMLA